MKCKRHMKYTMQKAGIGHEKVIMSKPSILICINFFLSVTSDICQLLLLTYLTSCSTLP